MIDDPCKASPTQFTFNVRTLIRLKLVMFRWCIQSFAPVILVVMLTQHVGREIAAIIGIGLVSLSSYFPPSGFDKHKYALMPGVPNVLGLSTVVSFVALNGFTCGFALALIARQYGLMPPWLIIPILAGLAIYLVFTCGFDTRVRKLFLLRGPQKMTNVH